MPHASVIPVHVELHHVKLGPRVPLMSNHPDQWIAASGMMLRAEVGSTTYGTDIPGVSDTDEMGICIEPKSTVMGLNRFEHYRFRTAEPSIASSGPPGVTPPSGPGDLDLTVYSLRKYVRLLCDGNPSLTTPLFVPESAIRCNTEFGEELRAHADKFLSQRAYKKFKGYMHKERLGLISPKGTSKHGLHALRLGMAGVELLSRGAITIPPRAEHVRMLRNVRAGRIGQREVLEKIERYDAMLDTALAKTPLPEEPNWSWVNTWLSDVHLRHWKAT